MYTVDSVKLTSITKFAAKKIKNSLKQPVKAEREINDATE